MSVVKNSASFVVRNRRFIGRTALYLGVIAVANTAFEKLVGETENA